MSTYVDIAVAPKYKGRVLFITGEQDQAFYGPGSSKVGQARCGSLLRETGMLFPNAEISWKSIGRMEHAMFLYRSARSSFAVIHEFLRGGRFEG